MSYKSIVYNVMVASPSDVAEEREAAREIILDWNNIHSASRKIVLLPSGWELNAIPTMGDHPQNIINKQVLENADLLLGIFWTRVGTPTEKAISGTVEEIEEHIRRNKPVMLYFSNKAIKPAIIDQQQYQAVNNLKTEFRGRGLTESFDTLEDFKNKFQRHLSMKMNSDSFFIGFGSEIEIDFEKLSGEEPLISKEAQSLLMEAFNDPAGTILCLAYFGGFNIQTNGKQFVVENDPRSEAQWQSALHELEQQDFVKTNNREIFQVTHHGYLFAEKLQ